MEYKKANLSPTIKRHIKYLEKELGRTCRKIWDFTNPKGEKYLFGSFCKNRDRLFVTIDYYNLYAHSRFIPSY